MHVRHIADEIVRRQALVIEKGGVYKEHSWHTKLSAKWRGPPGDRRISIIKCDENRAVWQPVAVAIRQYIL